MHSQVHSTILKGDEVQHTWKKARMRAAQNVANQGQGQNPPSKGHHRNRPVLEIVAPLMFLLDEA